MLGYIAACTESSRKAFTSQAVIVIAVEPEDIAKSLGNTMIAGIDDKINHSQTRTQDYEYEYSRRYDPH